MKKIPTLFERVFENHKPVRILPIVESDIAEKLPLSVPTVKIDGSCCSILNGEFYKRYDCKKGRSAPSNGIPCQEFPDPITGHWPFWVPVDFESNSDKWFVAAYDYHFNFLHEELKDGTYEAYGMHFNGNPYMLANDNLMLHGKMKVIDLYDFSFESIRQWLYSHNEEGIVFWYENQPLCKIKRTDFGFPWPAEKVVGE